MLGQLACANQTYEVLYTAPASTNATAIVDLANRTAGAITVRLAVENAVGSPPSPSDSEFIYYGLSIAANTTQRTTLVLNAADSIVVWASAGSSITASAHGETRSTA